MRGMILAAGFGTRLWPLTIGRTKPAIPFLNRPLIAYTIEYLCRSGVSDLVINLHHEPDSVREQIGDGSLFGARVSYSVEEPTILGTSGALDRVRDFLADDAFVVINGKIITDIELEGAIAAHRARRAMATLVLRLNEGHERFSEVEINPDGRINRFAGFPDPSKVGMRPAPLMFTGIQILDPSIFRYIPRNVFSDTVLDVYPAAMAAGEMVVTHVAKGDWFELSTLERYLSVSLKFLGRAGRNWIADEGCRLDPEARIERSVLWRRVQVEREAELVECIVGDDVRIPAGTRFHRAAIVRADLATTLERPEKATAGEILGDNLVVPI